MIKLDKGLSTDNNPIDQPTGTWRRAKNILVSDVRGAITNERGNIDSNINIPEDHIIIGIHSYDVNSYVVFSVNEITGLSEIGKVSLGNYSVIVRDGLESKFNFNVNNPIYCEHQRTFGGELIIAFTDNLNPPVILNIEDLPFQTSLTGEMVGDVLGLTKINKDVLCPTLTTNIVNGGSLLSGAYSYVAQYKINESYTNWFQITNPISVVKQTGSKSNINSGKAVSIQITNLDQRYDYCRIASVSRIDGILSTTVVDEFPIRGVSETVLHSNASVDSISFEELLTASPRYETAKTITQLDDRLYFANLISSSKIDYQPYANNIKVKYTEEKYNDTDYDNLFLTNSSDYKGFMHDEVYALYISLIFKDGSYSEAFHIPGRPVRNISGQGIGQFMENELCSTIKTVRPWMDSDELVSPDARYYQTRCTADQYLNAGHVELGFWENKNEYYPNDSTSDIVNSVGAYIGTLAGQKVRHHKMPTLSWNPDTGINETKVISLRVSDVFFPGEIENLIQGYQIFYAKRNTSNSTVISQDMTLFGAFIQDNQSYIDMNLTNHNYTTTSNHVFSGYGSQVASGTTINFDRVRFHGFDILRSTPDVSPSYIKNIYKLRHTGNFPPGPLLGETIVRYESLSSRSQVAADKEIIRIIENEYLLNDTSYSDKSNEYAESCIYLKLDYDSQNDISSTIDASNRGVQDSYLHNIVLHKDNCYTGVQELVSTRGISFDLSPTLLVRGGDTHSGYNSYLCTAAHRETKDDATKGLRSIHRLKTESSANMRLRYEDSALNQYYYPASGVGTEPYTLNLSIDINKGGYSLDHSALNTTNPVFPYERTIDEVNILPNRIIRSLQNTNDFDSNWFSFRPNDFYELGKNKGEINNIEGFKSELLIHTRDSLFITSGRDTIQADATNIVLGNNDIFAMKPQELMTVEQGYGGTVNQLSCVNTKLGYFFVDTLMGKCFILDGIRKGDKGLQEISEIGLRNFFRENLVDTSDNTFISSGVTVMYDEKYNRLILASKRVRKVYGEINLNNEEQLPEDLLIGDRLIFTGEYSLEAGTGISTNVYEYVTSTIGIQNVNWIEVEGNKFQAVFVSVYDLYVPIEGSFTISYSPLTNSWVSFHTYTPDYLFNTRNTTYSLYKGRIYEHNKGNKGVYYDNIINPSEIDVVFNESPSESKVFEAFNWITEVRQEVQKYPVYNETFSSIILYNTNQCSGEITLTRLKNTRHNESVWSFNDFRDIVKDRDAPFLSFTGELIPSNLGNVSWYNRRRMCDLYTTARFIYNNITNNELLIYGVEASFKKSYR